MSVPAASASPTEIALWNRTNATSRPDQFLGTAIDFDARSGLESAFSNCLRAVD
jgi:hypothetical protein